ncbi:daunorubicin ABC transporter ATP-binding protein [Sulfodiicoccus acidiphilus]|uniref:Daunorubicin ABC transporter ATP-binding protein n=1 Tax=Sulfodiicoccus acidiphilus TaxID=1670455 RepID=A0A348B275_9CREN|nr:ABC transporter permease [Sulfodiicoccus acidiphilus]BBD72277.1 daunorubicin ABC transporter ATP-binding protein [Sulfodiicoccus acidiphilus]GGT90596.1 daunorubicin ABC transporter ATP-binding protein [Sulfodiicoccus acidiphilus]
MGYRRTRFIAALAWFYGLSALKRGPIYVLSYMVSPLSLLFLIYVISRGTLVQYAVLGGLLGTVVGNSLTSIGDFAFLRLEIKLQDLVVATEAKPLDYLLGLTLGNLLFSAPGILTYIALGEVYRMFTPFNSLWTLLVVALIMMSSSSLSFLIASALKHVRYAWGLAGFLSVAFTIIPPLYYPASVLSSSMVDALMVIPSTPASLALQSQFGLWGGSYVLPTLILFLEAVVYPVLAVRFSRWREV